MEQTKIQSPDTSTLIGEQATGFSKLEAFLESGEQMFCFEGFAGVGKSFCTNMLVQKLLAENDTKICIAAPTHKALNVITYMAQFSSDNLTYSTIHALLGLRPEITSWGDEIFVKDSQNNNDLSDYDLLIIDESSMLDDKLFAYLKEELVKSPYLKIIFVGDGFQLPPINHKSSIPMSEDRRPDFDIGHYKLTQIVRQKGSNPVIEFSKEIREGRFKPRTMLNDNGHGVIVVRSGGYKKALKKFFCSGQYEENTDFCRVTAWTNKAVDSYNKYIRSMIYKNKIVSRMTDLKGKVSDDEVRATLMEEFPHYRGGNMDLPKYIVGDTVIADKPVFDTSPIDPKIIFHTSEELLIEDYTIETRLALGEAYKCYVAKVKNLFDGQHDYIEMIHEDDESAFNIHKERLKQIALKQKPKSKAARDKWVTYYSLDKRFARLKYSPAITTHKSQGSTYENVILDIPDMMQNRKQQELLQLLYVGVTRCTKRAILFV